MKKFKAYFKMMITAVICFAMSLVPGKKKGQAALVLSHGQGSAGTDKNKIAFLKTNAGIQGTTVSTAAADQKKVIDFRERVSADMHRFRPQSLQKYVLVPVVGPGDRVGAGHESLMEEDTG